MTQLLLLSGGLDSALCLHRFGAAAAVGFDYGQPHIIELEHGGRLAAAAGVPYEVVKLPPLPRTNDVVFAGRNAVMLSVAAAMAHDRGFASIMIGCNFSDAQRFPDCRPDFLRNIDRAFRHAYGVGVYAPLLTMSKAQIVADAREVGITDTWTCYAPREGTPCGECYSCKGLADAQAC